MKTHTLITTLTFIGFFILPTDFLGQKTAVDPEYIFHGPVKTMSISKQDYSEEKKELKSYFEYDKKGRKIREVSPYSTGSEYYYPDQNTESPVLTRLYNKQDNKELKISLEDQDSNGRKRLSGDLENEKWSYYYIYDYGSKTNEIRWFADGEIYHRETHESIDLEKFRIPEGFVPFEWDRNLSKGTDVKKKTFSDNDDNHDLTFEFVQKGNPENKVSFYYHGNDVYDSGRGTWYRYEDGKLTEERYVYSGSELSDFGHRYTYNDKGLLVSDHYGYFSKIPDDFMQRKVYQYNEKGDCIQETQDEEKAKPFVIRREYKYDSQNNWVSRKEIYGDGSGGTITRHFTYYKPGDENSKNSLTPAIYQENLVLLRQYKPTAENLYKDYLLALKQKNETQPKTTDYRKLRSAKWQDFLPSQQKLDTLATGDLNKDGLEDAVLVYEQEKLLKHERNEKRILRILLKQPDGQYTMAAESSDAVAGENMNNVFFTGIEIKKGLLVINHDFLRGGAVHKYRYQNNGFYLIGAESRSGDASHYSSIDYNLSTGKYVAEFENSESDPQLPKSYKKEGVKKISPLPEIETFELFSLEVNGNRL
ncbi:hypothetical protein [Chryseobacterium sp. 2987]|uniref:hypothetical protein n=1 Tax=Chryseobacterium sp. 2987 TaxID=2817767 RepID=UPI00285FDDDF|nr:hypothetical protein [Chryseobacterium sp. 2987]MDR6920862.1 hypothetical protein [Chryseobacterium sp. 2987]